MNEIAIWLMAGAAAVLVAAAGLALVRIVRGPAGTATRHR